MRTGSETLGDRPLDRILGTLSAVRVLRELTLADGPLTPPQLADRASLSRPSVRDALGRLGDAGIVAPVTETRYTSYRLVESHPLLDSIRTTFRAERARRDALLEALAGMARDLDQPPISLWVRRGGPTQDNGGSTKGESVGGMEVLALVATDIERMNLEARLGTHVDELAEAHGVPLSLRLVTEREVRNGRSDGLPSDDAMCVYGETSITRPGRDEPSNP